MENQASITAPVVDTIDVDEADTIDLSEYPGQLMEDEPKADAYDKSLCQDNKGFTKFLNKCLLLDQTFEMEQIIQKVILPAYVCADDEYKKSEKFTRVINKALQRLSDEPRKKYSYISDVTDTLKFHVKQVQKKRVDFVTLSTTCLSGRVTNNNRKRGFVINKHPTKSKKAKNDVIDIDSEEDNDVIPVDDNTDTFDDDITPVENTVTNRFDNVLSVVHVAKTNDEEELLIAHDIAKQIFADAIAIDEENKIEGDEVIAIDGETNESEINDAVAKAEPKKKKKLKKRLNENNFANLIKSKDRLANMMESGDKSNKKSLKKGKHKKQKDSKENCSPNSTLDVGSNNIVNIPIEVLDSQEIKMQEEEMVTCSADDSTEAQVNSLNAEAKEASQHNKDNIDGNDNLCDPNKLLVPRMEVALEENKVNEENDAKKFERMKAIEAEIVKYKKKIADLEVAEVVEDSSVSAYIQCDRLQAHIVKLYKELCALNNAVPVKGRQVRLLHLTESIPEGPVRRLERFLNKQVDEDGVAPFPDFADVVRCVEKSNEQDGLGWSKTRVHKEAHALFELCGRALQKRRQRREWKDLRAQLPRDEFEADPAAKDPELAAKLELNRLLALKRETEVLEEFCRLDATSAEVQRNEDTTLEPDLEESNASSYEEPVNLETPTIVEASEINPTTSETHREYTGGERVYVKTEHDDEKGDLVIRIKEEPYEVPIEPCFKLDVSIAIEISDSDSSDDDSDLYLT